MPVEKIQSSIDAIKKELNADKLQIGKKYEGGIVFYLDKTGNHGLVCSEIDFGEAQWGGYGVSDSERKMYVPFETSSLLGQGMKNTELIAKHANFKIVQSLFSSKKESILTAAELCLKSNHNGYNDWYLPNTSEFREIITNLVQKSVNANFIMRPAYYWSSCGLTHTVQASAFDIANKNSEIRGKGYVCWVRGIRKF